jgi:hypothetical protein
VATLKQRCFAYLNGLQDGGEINMLLAPAYLRAVFNLSKPKAMAMALAWMASRRKGETNGTDA